MTKQDIRDVVDAENGKGFSNNVNLNGYVFQKNGTFVVFELKSIDDVRVCHVKYMHVESKKDLTTVLMYCCNFWMGNNVQFIFYREKDRDNGVVHDFKDLGFREEVINDYQWKWRFNCKQCDSHPCKCQVHSMYK